MFSVVMIMMTIITIKSISYRLPSQRTFECGTFLLCRHFSRDEGNLKRKARKRKLFYFDLDPLSRNKIYFLFIITFFVGGKIPPMGVDKTMKLSSFGWWFPTGSFRAFDSFIVVNIKKFQNKTNCGFSFSFRRRLKAITFNLLWISWNRWRKIQTQKYSRSF